MITLWRVIMTILNKSFIPSHLTAILLKWLENTWGKKKSLLVKLPDILKAEYRILRKQINNLLRL